MNSLEKKPTPFEGPPFDDYQVEHMINEIGDILVFLQNNVIDYSKSKTVRLLDKDSTRIEFAKTEKMEVKRFIALVDKSRKQLQYMASGLTKRNEQLRVSRTDRVMGAISYSDTIRVRRQNSNSKEVVLWEIKRSFDTPSNNLLALVLISIVLYCEKYLSHDRLQNGDIIDSQSLEKLTAIRNWANGLLKIPTLRAILPKAIERRGEVREMLAEVQRDVGLGKAPVSFLGLYTLLYSWKFYLWVTSGDRDALRRALYYYFWQPPPNGVSRRWARLYESWVAYLVLRKLIDDFDLHMKMHPTPSSKAIDDLHMKKHPIELTFSSKDDGFKIRFQHSYRTKLIFNGKPVIDRPDISIKIKKDVMVVDAKNSEYTSLKYREKMQSYLRSTGAHCAIVIYSKARPGLWETAVEESVGSIIWTCLLPPTRNGNEETSNRETLDRLTEILRETRD